ncbi:hypothetical protein ABT336_19105 [Micromonospora sp. NPDC000207]|uniref:hypothetical protein n=1 Tax=Micromonospora sp. NPDC000207 TaxID=3154246 RepID=UPI003318BC19
MARYRYAIFAVAMFMTGIIVGKLIVGASWTVVLSVSLLMAATAVGLLSTQLHKK